MILRNFPLSSGRPKGREQTNHYIKALDLKNEADQVADKMISRNRASADLNPSDDSVALLNDDLNTGNNIGWAELTGVANFDEAKKNVFMQVDVDPSSGSDLTLTKKTDGDLVRYTRSYHYNSNVVEHMVHDTATDTFNYFLRTPEGHFVPKED